VGKNERNQRKLIANELTRFFRPATILLLTFGLTLLYKGEFIRMQQS